MGTSPAQTAKRQSGHQSVLLTVLANGILAAAALALLLAYAGPAQLSLRGEVRSTPEQRVALRDAAARESIDAQVAALGCDKAQRLSKDVAVRNAARTRGGSWQFDTTTVRRVSFDEGFAAAAAGNVWVEGWCG